MHGRDLTVFPNSTLYLFGKINVSQYVRLVSSVRMKRFTSVPSRLLSSLKTLKKYLIFLFIRGAPHSEHRR